MILTLSGVQNHDCDIPWRIAELHQVGGAEGDKEKSDGFEIYISI